MVRIHSPLVEIYANHAERLPTREISNEGSRRGHPLRARRALMPTPPRPTSPTALRPVKRIIRIALMAPDWAPPASSEFTGNFIDSGPATPPTAAKKGVKPEPYGPIPYASEQGIFCGLAGNLNRRSGKFPPRTGNPALVRYFSRPIRSSREISNTLPRTQRGTP